MIKSCRFRFPMTTTGQSSCCGKSVSTGKFCCECGRPIGMSSESSESLIKELNEIGQGKGIADSKKERFRQILIVLNKRNALSYPYRDHEGWYWTADTTGLSAFRTLSGHFRSAAGRPFDRFRANDDPFQSILFLLLLYKRPL